MTMQARVAGWWLVGLVAWCLLGRAGDAQEPAKRPMTFADLMAMKRVGDPQISPSGKWVMFSVTEVSLAKNAKVNHLWVVPLAGGGERQMTFGTANETNGRFSPDGRWVLYTSDVALGGGRGETQLWLVPWDEAAGTMGSPRSNLTELSAGADGGIWSPDSKRVLFVSSVSPECSDKGTWAEEEACDRAKDEAEAANPVKARVFEHLLYRHWTAFTGERRSHVLVVSLDERMGRTPGLGTGIRDLTPRSAVGDAEAPTFSLVGPLGYAWAPDSHEIAYVANLDAVPAASTNNDVFTLRLDEPGAKAVKVSTSLGSDDGPAYSPDGKWLAFRSQARAGYESDRFRLMAIDRKSRKLKEFTKRYDLWVDEYSWLPNSSAIVVISGVKGEASIRLFSNTDPVMVRERSEPGEFSDVRVLSNGTLVAARMGMNHPSELFASPPLRRMPNGSFDTDGEPGMITHINDARVNALALDQGDSYWFVGAEGTKVQGFLVRPPGFDPAKKYPVKFLIHGGPQGAWGDAWSYRWNAELMAGSGYVVMMVNPRGSTGYGQAFIDGVNGDWGGKAYVDLMKGLDAAEARFPFIDKTRECALGASYGGFMANWILTHTNRFACIVTHDGMYNPESAYGTTEEMWFNEWEFRRAEDFPSAAGPGRPAQPWRDAAGPVADDPFRKWSPMLHIQDAKTPTLVIHSQLDYRLDVSEGYQLFTALQRLGVPSKMLYFPDEGHWVLKPRNAELWNATVSDWCDRWTHSGKYAAAR